MDTPTHISLHRERDLHSPLRTPQFFLNVYICTHLIACTRVKQQCATLAPKNKRMKEFDVGSNDTIQYPLPSVSCIAPTCVYTLCEKSGHGRVTALRLLAINWAESYDTNFDFSFFLSFPIFNVKRLVDLGEQIHTSSTPH